MLKCTINGKEVEVKEGTTIIEAYKEMQEDIAHYCWHPGLSIAGVCRLCVVEIEGNPRLQIACNTEVRDGMVISNVSDKVEEAVRWGLDFHLINHPLDCPICDQAGECGLQEQYMKYGQYDSSMAENKVKKRKVVDLGPKIVLDAERCILCSRCVRFTEEISKTNELGIFNRGDHSMIGTVKDKPLDNDYSVNTVDICPVGALTSKDFRFQQRVWYLENTATTCPGCSTGCSVSVYHNKEGAYRVKPREDKENNGYWMCDEGRNVYKFVNKEARLLSAKTLNSGKLSSVRLAQALEDFTSFNREGKKVGVLLTGQNTTEEYKAILEMFAGADFFHWKNNEEKFNDFDGLLKRGDKNPNTNGLIETISNLKDAKSFNASNYDLTVAVMPENFLVYEDYNEKLESLKASKNLLLFSAAKLPKMELKTENTWVFPLKTFVEKEGSYLNHAKTERRIQKATSIVTEAVALNEFAAAVSRGLKININHHESRKQNEFTNIPGQY